MATDPTEEMVRREIAAARKIIQEDRHHAALSGLSERFDKHFPDNSDGGGDKPPTPPPTPPKEQPKRSSIWWGTPVE